jgi:hypothetical protein
MSQKCHDRLLGRDVDAMRANAGIEQRRRGCLAQSLAPMEREPKGRPLLGVVEKEAEDLKAARVY